MNPTCISKEGARKGGFFWSNESSTYIYHCFKCGMSMPLKLFLKKFFHDQYLELFLEGRSRKQETSTPTIKIENTEVREFVNYLFKTRQIIPLQESEDEEIWNYVSSRLIPQDALHRLFITENFFNIHQQIKQLVTKKDFDVREDSDKRIMWFFKTQTGSITALQGRRVDKKEPRYIITRFNQNDDRLIGGLEYINSQEPVYVVEGFIDSLFLPNAVSLNGLHFPSIKYMYEDLNIKQMYIVMDNEPNNKQIQRNIKSLINYTLDKPSLRVCLFPKAFRKKGKDINDYILSGVTLEEIMKTINTNSHSGVALKVRSIDWQQ